MKVIIVILFVLSTRLNAQNYFALVGNSWTYCYGQDTTHKRTYLIKDTINIEGVKYFLYGQGNPNINYNENKDYVSETLIKGSPASLIHNGYFSQTENISYAIIYKNQTDSLYFISKKVNADSNSYAFVLTSKNKITGYNLLSLKEIDNQKLFAHGKIITPYEKYFDVELYYIPKNEIIMYKFIKQNSSECPVLSTISKLKSAYAINFELGIKDEIYFMFTRLYNNRDGMSNYTKGILPPINFHLTAGLRFFNHFKIDFRLGMMYVYEDYYGLDKGIFFQADLFNTNFYGIVGIDFFNNGGEAHGVSTYSESGGTTTSFCLGLGFFLSRNFILDFIYYFPKDKIFGYNLVVSSVSQHYDKINNGLLVFGFQYVFIF